MNERYDPWIIVGENLSVGISAVNALRRKSDISELTEPTALERLRDNVLRAFFFQIEKAKSPYRRRMQP